MRIIDSNGDNITVEVQCPFCGSLSKVEVNFDAFQKWNNGARIQDAMPDVDADTREILISGICKKCQEDVFA